MLNLSLEVLDKLSASLSRHYVHDRASVTGIAGYRDHRRSVIYHGDGRRTDEQYLFVIDFPFSIDKLSFTGLVGGPSSSKVTDDGRTINVSFVIGFSFSMQ